MHFKLKKASTYGGTGGNGGSGANGKDALNMPDYKLYESDIEGHSGWSSWFSFAGKQARDMPGRGGSAGLAGIHGAGGRVGRVHLQPPIPKGSRHVEVTADDAASGNDGAPGCAGEPGDGGCDGKSVVGRSYHTGAWWWKSFHWSYTSFYASCDFRSYGQYLPSTWFWQAAVEAPKVRGWTSIDLAKEFIHKRVLIRRLTLRGKAATTLTSACEQKAANLTMEQIMKDDGDLAREVEGLVGELATQRSQELTADEKREGVGALNFTCDGAFLSALLASVRTAQQALQRNSLASLGMALQQGNTIEEASTMLSAQAEAVASRTHTTIDFRRRDTAVGDADADGAAGSLADDAADVSLRELFHHVGAISKSQLLLVELPTSHFFVAVLPSLKRYSASVRRVKQGRGNVVQCLMQLSHVLHAMHSQEPSSMAYRYAGDMACSLQYAWTKALPDADGWH